MNKKRRDEKMYKAIERFKQYKIIDCQIVNKQNRLKKLESQIEYGGISTDPFKTQNGDCSIRENKIASYIDEKDKLEKEIKELEEEYSILTKAYETLSKNEKIVIEETLLKQNSLTWISTHSLYYSERQLKRIKLAGMIKLKKCLS